MEIAPPLPAAVVAAAATATPPRPSVLGPAAGASVRPVAAP